MAPRNDAVQMKDCSIPDNDVESDDTLLNDERIATQQKHHSSNADWFNKIVNNQ